MNALRRLFGWGPERREADAPAARTAAASPAVPELTVGDAPAARPAPVAALPPVLDYPSWELVPPGIWIWPHFTPRELACRGTGRLLIQRRALDALQALRRDIGKPLVITSGYRSPEHNARVGGAQDSRHMQGDAFDVVMTGHDPLAFVVAARRVGFRGFGFYPRNKPPFLHIDMGRPRTWGDPL